jgi:type VI protein secretion system component VasK
MSRAYRVLTSLIVIITFTVAVCVVKPQPAHADNSTETILIVLGAVIGGLALFALIMTLIVRNNPAWMPIAQGPDLQRYDRFRGPPESTVHFGLGCGVRDGAMPLVCW